MRIIPAIDILGGKCVRLTQGNYTTQKVYSERPLEVAKRFEGAGIQYLHIVDLDGAKAKHIINYNALEQIATKTSIKIDFGGGIKADDDIRIAFECGASQITGGSVAVNDKPRFISWKDKYGTDKVILGADANNRKIATNGWLETSEVDVLEFVKDYADNGIEYVICTDIAKDGMLAGPSLSLYQEILAETGVKLIASGGVTTIEDIIALQNIGCEGAIIGKAIYENRISLQELAELC